MSERELEEIALVRIISAPPKAVYKAWTDPELMKHWLAPEPNRVVSVTNDLKPGGEFNIEMQAPDGVQHFINGFYQLLTPSEFIAKSWKYSGPFELIRDIDTLLEIKLVEAPNATTELTLTQSRMKSKSVCDAYAADWPSCLDKLNNFFLH